jgi:PAS domain S-box-containing protein
MQDPRPNPNGDEGQAGRPHPRRLADCAIFMLDIDGRVVTWNLGAERVHGYRTAEIIGEHFSEFFPPEDVASGKPERELAIAKEHGGFEDDSWRVRKDGSRFWANVVITALRDDHGLLRGFAKVTRDLSASKDEQERLHQAEQRFHHLVDAITDYAVFMLDGNGRVATWNLGAEKIKGYSAHDVIGQHFSIFYTPEDRADRKPERVLQTVRGEGRFEDEGWRVRKGGSRFWANVIVTGLRDKDGHLIGFAKITRDLTVRREAENNERRLSKEQAARELAEEAEQRIRVSEERYRAVSRRLEVILEGVADGIMVQERSGRLLFANTAAARVCGFHSVAELTQASGKEVFARFRILDEDDAPFDIDNLPGRRALRGEQPPPTLLRVRERSSGREWWSLVRATAVLGSDGRPELAINIFHDVTAQRRHEQQTKWLADATAALGLSLDREKTLSKLASALVPGLGDWCSIHLLDGGELQNLAVAHIDPTKVAAARLYREKYPSAPNEARGIWNVIRGGRSEVYNDISEELLTRSAQSPEHLEVLRAVGMKAVVVAPIRIRGDVVGAISIVSAESDRRYDESDVALVEELGRRVGLAVENAQLYKAAQDAATRAEEASRVKDEFLATVSHELRTPLNAIVGWSTLLKERVQDPGISKPIDVIYRNAQSQVKIIEDILDLSRVITGKLSLEPKPTDLVAIARDTLEVVRPSAIAKEVTLEFRPPVECCLLVADPERIRQVIWNLLSNAVKFTGGGGKVQLCVSQDGPNIVLTVRDTGKGIEPTFLPFVFERFRQADSSKARRAGGLGLGLSLVRHIVELHGGRVAADSEGPGRGSSFVVTLPVRAGFSSVPPDQPSSPRWDELLKQPSMTLATVRVLIVDDEADARDLIASALVDAGACVETARSAPEGFDQLKQHRPDVLISDIGLPGEDGLSFIARVRGLTAAEGGRVPALALTAYAGEADRTQALTAGFTSHIGKPVAPAALVSAVSNLVVLGRSS